MNHLPVTGPAEALEISPEGLEVANCYLQNPSPSAVADELGIPLEIVTNILDRREVRSYIDHIFYSSGFNNRFKLSSVMDAVIAKKLQEMDEADVGSTKDITEILALKHKMLTDHMAHELAMAKVAASNVKTQLTNNIQINSGSGESKYSALIEKLMGGTIDV